MTPNDDPFRWMRPGLGMNLSGMYRHRPTSGFAIFLQAKNGLKGQRTTRFAAVDPDGGPRLNQLGSVTLRMEPYGSVTGDTIASTNLRVSKDLAMGRGRSVSFDVDFFNVFNSGVPTNIGWLSGPSYGAISEVLSARIVRFGARFRF